MAVAVEDVKCWYVESAVGHVVARIDGGHLWTACGNWLIGHNTNAIKKRKPARVCRACRERLKVATPVQAAV